MLERAKGCLEAGGRHLLTFSRQKPTRSRRSLHSTFWCHGAGDIDLPLWWMALLQHSPTAKGVSSEYIADTAQSNLTAGLSDVGFLEFLYPTKTINLIHRFATRDGASRKQRAYQQVRQNSLRPYSSDTLGERWTGQSITDYPRDTDIKSQKNILIASAERTAAPSLEDRLAGLLPIDDGYSHPILDDIKRLEPSIQRYRSKLQQHQKLEARADDFRDVTEILASTEDVYKSGLSILKTYARYRIKLFLQIEKHEYTEKDYKAAIDAVIQLGEFELALSLNREALLNGLGLGGMPSLFYHLIDEHQWEAAVRAWDTYQEFSSAGKKPDSSETAIRSKTVACVKDDLLHQETVPVYGPVGDWLGDFDTRRIQKKALALARATIKSIDETGLASNEKLLNMAIYVIFHTFSRRNADISFSIHTKLFWLVKQLTALTAEQYEEAIRQLLSIEADLGRLDQAGRRAMAMYRDMQSDVDITPSSSLLQDLFLRNCRTHRLTGAQLLYHDIHKFYGEPSPYLMRQMMYETAYHGDAQSFHEIFDELRGRLGSRMKDQDYHKLLSVHFRRAEVEKVVQYFEALEPDYGFVPDNTCWNTVIAVYSKVSDTEGALKFYRKMLERGLKPQADTLATLMNAFAPGGDVEAIEKLIKECEERKLPLHTSMVDSLVLAHIKNDDVEEAEKIVTNALDMPLVGTKTRMWNYVLNACAMQRDPDRVNYLHRCMQQAGIPEDGVTYAALMQSLSIVGLPGLAHKILRKVMPQKHIPISAFHYAIVLGGLIKTKEYRRVFHIYRQMLRYSIRPTFSTQSLLAKAVAALDVAENGNDDQNLENRDLKRAEQIFEATIASIDPMDIAGKDPIKGLGEQRLDEAYISSYFDHLIFLYGQTNNLEKVSVLFDRYIETMHIHRPGHDISPPVKITTALMVAYARQSQHEEVEQCWYLALAKTEPFARRINADLAKPGWVLPARRFVLCTALVHYLKSLEAQQRFSDIDSVVTKFQSDGYALNNKAWNAYVQIIAQSRLPGCESRAFAMAERELMSGWQGWPNRGGFAPAIKAVLRRRQPTPTMTRQRMPTYKTMVFLAGAYLDFRTGCAFSRDQALLMQRLYEVAPGAVTAVNEMPRIDDQLQLEILRRR